ncbi:MAG: hypothetical protein JST85_10310 [Acidobacteria bacterium]|nr:hypothetical protein [Acidobacteriota bacterium]
MSIVLLFSLSIGLLAFTGYKQLTASKGMTGKIRLSNLQAKSVVTPKADLVEDIVNELLKFIKKY